jgi:hypothetical protein
VKKYLATAAIALLMTTAAHAMKEIRSGSWTAYGGLSHSGTPTCGMTVTGGGRDFHIKYQPVGDGNAIYFQMFKNTWRFSEGNEVPLVLGFDKNEMLKATGTTFSTKNSGSSVEFFIRGELIGDFLREFGEATKMWIKFEAGNEEPWIADMVGSRNAMQMFKGCVSKTEKPTQPFGTAPQASQPTQPVKPTSPVKPTGKKDDGSV